MGKGIHLKLYCGGLIFYDRGNPWYTIPHKGSLWCPVGYRYEDLRRLIYKVLCIEASANLIRVQIRVAYYRSPTDFGFTLVPVFDDESLNLVVSKNLIVPGIEVGDVYIDILPRNGAGTSGANNDSCDDTDDGECNCICSDDDENKPPVEELYGNRQVSYRKASYENSKAIMSIFGDWVESYNNLPRFMNALKSTNPGSVHRIESEPGSNESEKVFKRMFFAFKPCIEGFIHCRPVVVINANDLNGQYEGKLFTAVGQDANGGIFPLAFGFAETESEESWGYFLKHLYEQVVQDREEICIISDRHLGITSVFESGGPQFQPPRTHHRFCMRHVQSSFCDKFKNFPHLYDDFWKLATTTDTKKFNAGMAAIKRIDDNKKLVGRPKPYAYLMGIERWKWTLLYDWGRRYGVKTANPCEVFNTVLRGAREIPITAAVDSIFKKLVVYFGDKFEKKFLDDHVPEVYEKLKILSLQGRNFKVQGCGDNIYLVFRRGNMCWTVDIREKTCTCPVWGMTRFPCEHAMAVEYKMDEVAEKNLLEECDTLEAYKKTWAKCFRPIPHKSLWPPVGRNQPVLVPDPLTKRGASTQKTS